MGIYRLNRRLRADAEPTIVCADDGQRVVLMALDEFNAWREKLSQSWSSDSSTC